MSDEQIDGERQMLVEHLDVVARVFLRRERVELAADRVDRLRDVFGGARVGALEEHVLDEVRDAAALVALVPRAAHQPHADRHRPHVRHRLGDEAETVVEDVANNHALRSCAVTRGASAMSRTGKPARCTAPRDGHRKLLR